MSISSSSTMMTVGASSRRWSRPQLLSKGRSYICHSKKLSLVNFRGIDILIISEVSIVWSVVVVVWLFKVSAIDRDYCWANGSNTM